MTGLVVLGVAIALYGVHAIRRDFTERTAGWAVLGIVASLGGLAGLAMSGLILLAASGG